MPGITWDTSLESQFGNRWFALYCNIHSVQVHVENRCLCITFTCRLQIRIFYTWKKKCEYTNVQAVLFVVKGRFLSFILFFSFLATWLTVVIVLFFMWKFCQSPFANDCDLEFADVQHAVSMACLTFYHLGIAAII